VGESASGPELFFRERVTAAATDLEICFPSHFWTQVESYKNFWREANKLDVGAAISKHKFLLLLLLLLSELDLGQTCCDSQKFLQHQVAIAIPVGSHQLKWTPRIIHKICITYSSYKTPPDSILGFVQDDADQVMLVVVMLVAAAA
jgi:hypothetical protein